MGGAAVRARRRGLGPLRLCVFLFLHLQQVRVHHPLFVDSDVSCVGPDESLAEHPARQVLEVVALEGLEKPHVDLGRVGDLAETDVAKLTLPPELLAERGHSGFS